MDPKSPVAPPHAKALELTGERMVPEWHDPVGFWEHIYRYRFATGFVGNKRVLDVACGEGYGTAGLLKAGAKRVIGVDISEGVCRHARSKYGVDAIPGSAVHLPVRDRSIDVIVSFETIEHLVSPEAFLDECVRVLAPGGTLVLSTPDKEVFRMLGIVVPYHLSEMNASEFAALLTRRFSRCDFYGQRLRLETIWSTRSFSAESTPWVRVRGFVQLRHWLRWALCPKILDGVSENYRSQPEDAILEKDPLWAHFVNPFPVQRCRPGRKGKPVYRICVANVS